MSCKVLYNCGRPVEEGQAVLHLIQHRQLGRAQQTRLPQCVYAARQRLVVVLAFLGRHLHAVALIKLARNGHLAVQDTLALYFGRMRGEHGADVGAGEKLVQRVGAARVHHILHRPGQAARARRGTG
jgi:hypothetical protein